MCKGGFGEPAGLVRQREVFGGICEGSHYGHTGDIYVCGVRPECHRMGLGRALYGRVEQFFLEKGCKYAMVETLSEKAGYEPYEKTRSFYESVGFEPLITLTEMWDENNPCIIMVKFLALQTLATGMNRRLWGCFIQGKIGDYYHVGSECRR